MVTVEPIGAAPSPEASADELITILVAGFVIRGIRMLRSKVVAVALVVFLLVVAVTALVFRSRA